MTLFPAAFKQSSGGGATLILLMEAVIISPASSVYSRQPRIPVGHLMDATLEPLYHGRLQQGHSA